MASPQELISDVLNLPPEERKKLHEQNPTLSSMVKTALETNPDYAQLPETEKARARLDLGFSPIALAPLPEQQLGPPAPTFQQRLATMEAQPQPSLPSIGEAISSTEYRKYWQEAFQPIRETFAQPSAPARIPGTDIALYDIGAKGGFGKVARGFTRAIPGVSAVALPENIPEPSFLSVENASRIATEAIITYPIFASSFVAGTAKQLGETALLKFITRYPAIAHAVANASVQAGPVAAYQVFSEKLAEAIQKGHVTWDGILQELGPAYGNAVGILLGFHGAIKGAGALLTRTPVIGPFIKGWQAAGKAAQLEAEAKAAAQASAKNTIVENIAQDIGEAPVIAAIPPAPAVSLPPPKGGRLTELAQKAITTEVQPTQQLLTKTMPILAPAEKPGFLLTAEERIQRYPKASKIVDDVTSPTQTEVLPNGSITASIPENAIKAGFIASENALVGDLVYAGGRVAKVLEKVANGLKVQSSSGATYFMPFEKVTGKARFAVGDEVVLAGKPVVVESISTPGTIRVVNETGTRITTSEAKLSIADDALHAAETAERSSMGIQGSAPEGSSIWSWLDDIGKDRPGFFRPRIFGIGEKPPQNTIPVHLTTQPDPNDFGTYRYGINAAFTLLMQNSEKYTLGAKMLYDSKAVETVSEEATSSMLKNLKKLVGADYRVSEKLTRFLAGVPLAGESLTANERAVVSTMKMWAQANIIPALNARRAAIGQAPIPPDYNYVFQLFPEVLLTKGSKAFGLAEMYGNFIKPTGVENVIDMPWGKNVRLEIEANFWELADRFSKFVSHERAWRDTITYFTNLAGAEKSASNKKFLDWLVGHIEGTNVSPYISDLTTTSSWVDRQIMKRFAKGSATFVDSQGKRVEILVPAISFSDKNLHDVVMTAKTLNYAAMIGFNLRTITLNLSQPVTNGLAQIPGNPIAATFDLALGYAKAGGVLAKSLFNENALKEYRNLGVLHDMEELFMSPTLTKTRGGAPRDVLYGAEWLYNTVLDMSFLGMRKAELINRVAVYEGHLTAGKRLAQSWAKDAGVARNIIDGTDFQEALSRMAAYASNISNFLYGKAFKAPLQTGFLPGREGGRQTSLSPIGEMLYTFNTFATNHMANMALLLKQSQRFGDHLNAAGRMAAIGAPTGFGQYLASLHPSERYAFLRALTYQWTLGQFMTGLLGFASLGAQISPFGLTGIDPLTTMIKSSMSLVKDFFQMDIYGIGKTLKRSFVPGQSASQRWQRGGTTAERLLSTRSDIEGKPSPYAPPATWYDSFFGPEQSRYGGTKAP